MVSVLDDLAAAWGAPPLTTIQDVLYKADGTLFNGLLIVEWKSFQAADGSEIAMQSLRSPIVNGVVRVQLTPTTNALTSGASYTATYNSDGKIQFQEIWAVPPGTAPVRIRDIRVATIPGGQVVAPPAATAVTEADVTGLVDDLAIRPVKAPGYAPSRVAFINALGALEAIVGDLGDCVRVDGTTGPCGNFFVDNDTPIGAINGVNVSFSLSYPPAPAESLQLYRNGLLQRAGVDYSLAGAALVFNSVSIPVTGDSLVANYRQ